MFSPLKLRSGFAGTHRPRDSHQLTSLATTSVTPTNRPKSGVERRLQDPVTRLPFPCCHPCSTSRAHHCPSANTGAGKPTQMLESTNPSRTGLTRAYRDCGCTGTGWEQLQLLGFIPAVQRSVLSPQEGLITWQAPCTKSSPALCCDTREYR